MGHIELGLAVHELHRPAGGFQGHAHLSGAVEIEVGAVGQLHSARLGRRRLIGHRTLLGQHHHRGQGGRGGRGASPEDRPTAVGESRRDPARERDDGGFGGQVQAVEIDPHPLHGGIGLRMGRVAFQPLDEGGPVGFGRIDGLQTREPVRRLHPKSFARAVHRLTTLTDPVAGKSHMSDAADTLPPPREFRREGF